MNNQLNRWLADKKKIAQKDYEESSSISGDGEALDYAGGRQ